MWGSEPQISRARTQQASLKTERSRAIVPLPTQRVPGTLWVGVRESWESGYPWNGWWGEGPLGEPPARCSVLPVIAIRRTRGPDQAVDGVEPCDRDAGQQRLAISRRGGADA